MFWSEMIENKSWEVKLFNNGADHLHNNGHITILNIVAALHLKNQCKVPNIHTWLKWKMLC